MGAFEEYRQSVESARRWFAENHAGVVTACNVLNEGFSELGECLRVGRDSNGKTHISLAPLLFILQRQAFVALDMLASRQAYQAWLIVRPGIESALIIGKWLDDPGSAAIWEKREEDPKPYAREYSGTRLRSKSLRNSEAIQQSLKRINDLLAHPNPNYYTRHTKVKPAEEGMLHLGLAFFDNDEFHWASILAMLHLLIVTQDTLARAFADVFVNVGHAPERYGLVNFQRLHREQASKAAQAGIAEAQIINNIGLWYLVPAV